MAPAAVYLASRNETLVALKVLLPAVDDSGPSERSRAPPPVLQALQRECGMMASLRHPNVVLWLGVCYSPPAIITGACVRGGRRLPSSLCLQPASTLPHPASLCLTVCLPSLQPSTPAEFCSRGSLCDVLRAASQNEAAAAALTWPRRLGLALDAARGMLALHTHSPPIVHRDLKSPNLLVDAAWRCKVAGAALCLGSVRLPALLRPACLSPAPHTQPRLATSLPPL